MSGVRVSVTDHGFKKLMSYLNSLKGLDMTVGLHSEDADGAVMEAAELNEFGSPGGMIPARPAITGWADDNREAVVGDMKEQMRLSYRARKDPLQRIAQLANKCAGEVQANIASGIDPPNAESTIQKKGSSTPLIDDGVFRSSIAGKVAPR